MKLSEFVPPILNAPFLKLVERKKFAQLNGKEELRKNAQLKGVAKGKRAFMIATGPSIKQEDLSKLAGEDCYSISNFFLHEKLSDVNPIFHFFAPYHEPLVLDNYISWLRQADQTLPKQTQMVLCLRDKQLIEENHLFENRQIHYVQFSNTPYFSNKVDLTYPILSPITGPLMMLPVLMYMGYSEIYLLGCDHTVMRDYKKHIQHFYDSEKDARKNASDSASWEGIISSLHYTTELFKQYQFYNEMALLNQNTRIINLSQDTWLDFVEMNQLNNII